MGDAGSDAGLQTGETGETGGQPGDGAGSNRGNRAPADHVGRESDDFRGEDDVRPGGEEIAVGGGKSAARRRADAARAGVSAAGFRGSEWGFGARWEVESSICAKVGFVQPEGNVSGLGVGKINVQRTKGEYNWTSSVSKILQSGSYDVQM